MGLDMNAFAKSKNTQDALQYWRKHSALHGWMTSLAIAKGVVEEPMEFNCENVELTLDDLSDLETAINEWTLPETSGFFFGNYPPDEETNKIDLEFVDRARAAIKEGKQVYYTSWW